MAEDSNDELCCNLPNCLISDQTSFCPQIDLGQSHRWPSSAEADQTTHHGGLGHEASNPRALPGSNAVEDHEDLATKKTWRTKLTMRSHHVRKLTSSVFFQMESVFAMEESMKRD
jgi:hypothetical protein